MKTFENPLRFDKIMVESLVAYFFGPPCTIMLLPKVDLQSAISRLKHESERCKMAPNRPNWRK